MENENKKSFIVYCDYKNHIDLLSQEQKGDVLDAMFAHAEGVENNLTGMSLMAFSFIKSQMDRDADKYEKVRKRRAEAGKAGGIAKASNAKQTLANASNAKQTLANLAVTDTVTVTVTGNDTDNGNVISKKDTIAYDDIVTWWNDLSGEYKLTKVRALSPQRKTALKLRIKEIGDIDAFKTSIHEAISNSTFLQGQNNTGWRCDFDFILKQKSFIKIIEGGFNTVKKLTASEKRVADFQKLRENRQ